MEKPALSQSPVEATLRTFSIHNRIDLHLLDHLDPAAWLLPQLDGKGRTLSAMAAHMHSVRLMWLKAGKVDPFPARLKRSWHCRNEGCSGVKCRIPAAFSPHRPRIRAHPQLQA